MVVVTGDGTVVIFSVSANKTIVVNTILWF